MKRKILTVVGARPNFIKVAPLLEKFRLYKDICSILVHTGQHYDYKMSQAFFQDLKIPQPNYHLGVGSGLHADQTARTMLKLEPVLLEEKPDFVIVVGDVNSTLAGALVAAKLHIPVAHVEAGLRSFNRRMPEEINRVLTDHISSLLFCPTETAVENLRREGFTNILNDGQLLNYPSSVSANSYPLVANVGDVMYDAVLHYGDIAEKKSRILEELRLNPKAYALATVHRAENTDEPERLQGIFDGLKAMAQEGLPVVFSIHPRTQKQVNAFGIELDGIRVIDPLSYLDMLLLEKHARVILTDSGGVQKEAFFFRVPCVTLREETEWVETVEAGWNTLVGYNQEQILQAALGAKPGIESAWPYGDGRAAERMVHLFTQNALWRNQELWAR